MASEKVSRKMVLEIKYVNANNAVIHTENSKLLLDLNCKLVTGILAKISLGTGIWAKFRLGTGIWYPPSRPSYNVGRGKSPKSEVGSRKLEGGSRKTLLGFRST